MGIYHENHQCECTCAIEWGYTGEYWGLLIGITWYKYGIIASISWEMGTVEKPRQKDPRDKLVTNPSTNRSIIFPY